MLREGLRLNGQLGDMYGTPPCLLGLAVVSAVEGRAERGARLLDAVGGLLERVKTILDPDDAIEYERSVATVQVSLDVETYRATLVEGRSMPLEQAIAYALEEQG